MDMERLAASMQLARQVKETIGPQRYNQFLIAMQYHNQRRISTQDLVQACEDLFDNNIALLDAFKVFLPPSPQLHHQHNNVPLVTAHCAAPCEAAL